MLQKKSGNAISGNNDIDVPQEAMIYDHRQLYPFFRGSRIPPPPIFNISPPFHGSPGLFAKRNAREDWSSSASYNTVVRVGRHKSN